MRCLFVHQNAPGQYVHVIRALAADPANEVVVLSQPNQRHIANVRRVEYTPDTSGVTATRQEVREFETSVANAEAVRQVALALRRDGFRPDIMIGHNGWGETLFLKDVWPDAPLVGYFEFFYRTHGADVGFDPEFPIDEGIIGPRLRLRNTVNLLGLDAADWGQTPTLWQAWQYPAVYRSRMSVFHEGIDTDRLQPKRSVRLQLPGGTALSRQDEVITYVARNLEPYRGFHIFMRALPEILRRRPRARVLVVGGDGVSYGGKLAGGKTYREALLEQVGSGLDLDRVHFLGHLPYEQYLGVLQVSSVHVYLTYPFVLSWSMLEAMSAGCLVLGSTTPPVMEVIRDGDNGLLTDFFDIPRLVDRIDYALSEPEQMDAVRGRARDTVLKHYDLKTVCLPRNLRMIEELIAGRQPPTYQDQGAGVAPRAVYTLQDALQLAWRHLQGGDAAAAETIYRNILGQRPDTMPALFRLGQILAGRGQLEEAGGLIAKAAALAPGNPEIEAARADLQARLPA